MPKGTKLVSAHPQMALLRDFSMGRRDLNPQNSTLFTPRALPAVRLRFKSDARLELTQNPSFVDRHEIKSPLIDCWILSALIRKFDRVFYLDNYVA